MRPVCKVCSLPIVSDLNQAYVLGVKRSLLYRYVCEHTSYQVTDNNIYHHFYRLHHLEDRSGRD
jgi:hypothetical protein